MNLLYLLLCYAIIKTEDGAGQKEMMVFTQRSRLASESELFKKKRCEGSESCLQDYKHNHGLITAIYYSFKHFCVFANLLIAFTVIPEM